ncbi:hypothetical protein LINPERHAP1_LOCUS8617 [Linum perenne]
MKLLNGQIMKRVQFQRWGKRIRKGPLGWCCSRSYVPKKWVYKFKAQWKKAIGWKKSSTTTPSQYKYDIQSYSLNFDDGSCK